MRLLALRFTQPCDPLVHRVQIIADHARVAHFAPPPRRSLPAVAGYRRHDTVLVDIQSQIEFFLHWCVCLFSVVKTATTRTLRGVAAALRPFTGEVARA